MKNINIGLAGCGLWGHLILRELIAMKIQVEVFDTDPLVADRLPDFVPFYSKLNPFLKGSFDGYIVATPASTHMMVLQDLMGKDLPIFIEKPLVTSILDAEYLQHLNHSGIFVMHIWKYHPGIRMLGSLVRERVIGDILFLKTMRANWTSPRKDIDTVWNCLPHDLSIIETVLGYIPEPKFARSERHEKAIRGMTVLFGDRPYCQCEISNRYFRKDREVRIHGTLGVAVLQSEKVDHINLYRGDHQTNPSQLEQESISFDFSKSPLALELQKYINYLQGGEEPLSTLKEGIRYTQIIHEIRRLAEIK